MNNQGYEEFSNNLTQDQLISEAKTHIEKLMKQLDYAKDNFERISFEYYSAEDYLNKIESDLEENRVTLSTLQEDN